MIDPVGTGFSKPVGDFKDKDFWGVDPDIESVSRFIQQYVTDNGRWNSPKYLIGESYGTTRSAGVVDWLQSKAGMSFNGVVLVSVAMDLGAIFALPGNDVPYPLYLPSYAATAAYHKLVPAPADLNAWLAEVRRYAAGEYTAALAEGARLPDDRRAAVIKKLHEYTGLSEEYLRLADLRVYESPSSRRSSSARRGSRSAASIRASSVRRWIPLAKETEDDPQSNAISGAYTAAFLDWLPRRAEVRRRQDVRRLLRRVPDVGLQAQDPGPAVPVARR